MEGDLKSDSVMALCLQWSDAMYCEKFFSELSLYHCF